MRPRFRITVCGLHELAGHAEASVSHVLSILDPDWPAPTAFGSYGDHARLELRFHDIIDETPGMLPPTREHVMQLLAFGRGLPAEADAHLLVHCHAGVSRSSASMALLLAQAMPECPAPDLFREILRVRPEIWPNLRIIELGDQALGRDGALITSAHDVYRRQISRRPELVEEFKAAGRAREVDAAIGVGA